jgi:putative flippase GtrA
MGRSRRLAIGVAVVGTTASLIAAALLWLLVTHPIAVAQAIAKGL